MLQSFIVTGASASGKSTLINEARKNYIYLPTHMTRDLRKNEVNGIDAIFINEEQFIKNFNEGMYLEDSLDFAFVHSLRNYYGSPSMWIEKLKEDGYCASPVSIVIAEKIVSLCTNLCWVHLYCPNEIRYERLINRGISQEEASRRMNTGDSRNIPQKANLVLDTSKNSPVEILSKINNYKK